MKNEDNIVRCPRCGGRDVRLSNQKGFWDPLMRLAHRVPWRCRSCQGRFYLLTLSSPESPPEEKVTEDGATSARRGENG